MQLTNSGCARVARSATKRERRHLDLERRAKSSMVNERQLYENNGRSAPIVPEHSEMCRPVVPAEVSAGARVQDPSAPAHNLVQSGNMPGWATRPGVSVSPKSSQRAGSTDEMKCCVGIAEPSAARPSTLPQTVVSPSRGRPTNTTVSRAAPSLSPNLSRTRCSAARCASAVDSPPASQPERASVALNPSKKNFLMPISPGRSRRPRMCCWPRRCERRHISSMLGWRSCSGMPRRAEPITLGGSHWAARISLSGKRPFLKARRPSPLPTGKDAERPLASDACKDEVGLSLTWRAAAASGAGNGYQPAIRPRDARQNPL
jgi:hypothetical protein